MPDITMCKPAMCFQKEKCYRNQAKPSERQSWNIFEYDDKHCDNFMPMINVGTVGYIDHGGMK